MFKNNFKIAWRNLMKDRQFSLLNLLGLSTGLACALMVYLWISDELRIDKYNEKDARLYQVMANLDADNKIQTITYTAGLLGKSLAEELPEVEYAASVLPASWFSSNGILTSGETKIKAGGEYVSKDYFNIFTVQFVAGDKQRLFADKYAAAISDELAKKLFNTTHNVIGKPIKWEQGEFSGSFLVTAVFKKLPPSATEQFDLIFNYDFVLDRRPNLLNWGNSDPSTYILVKQGTDIARLNAKIRDFVERKVQHSGKTLFATRFSGRYLHGTYENGVQVGGRIVYIRLFSIIGIFILVIACINFMNLSTARAVRRLKEVGIKKVVGASRSRLIVQYLTESILLTLLSSLVAIAMVATLLPAFNQLTGKHLGLAFNASLLISIGVITLITGLIAGSYPAFYLSSFNPVAVLKGKLNTSFGEQWVRKGLVIFQFTLSVVFIAAVLIVYRQLNFIQSKDLGYNRDHIIHFEIPLEMDSARLSAAATFVDELNRIPGVVGASSYYHNLTGDHGGISDFHWAGKDPQLTIDFANLEVGYRFLETAGIKIHQGRNFSLNSNAHNEIIFNETAIKAMGLKDPVGKMITFWGMERQIVGVAADFNFESLYQPVKPCFFQVFPVMPNIMVRIKSGMEKATIGKVEKAFAAFNPGLAFDYRFLDEDYRAVYASERRVGVLARYFAGLAIIISCLGLFGLAAFTAHRRQKEIGIRKVVGASASSLAFLLSTEFLKLVGIAMLIAFPLVGWVMNNWLDNFAYRIHIGVDVYWITALATVLITVLTVGFQSVKTALLNPVKSLRTE